MLCARRFSIRLFCPAFDCKRNIEMTPLCKIEVTHLRVLGSGRCAVAVLSMSKQEFSRLDVLLRVQSGREEVVPNGDSEITFRLKRPQPSFIVLLASGFTPIYPCHVSPRDMRSHPIG